MDVDDIGTSNLVNQLVFSSLFLISTFSLVFRYREVLQFIKREKFLTIFMGWCLLSVFWSDYSFVAFKRFFQVLTTVTVCLAFLLHTDTSERAHSYFRAVLFLYIPITLAAIVLIPGAIDPDHGTWRGLAPSKNFFGQVLLVSILVWVYRINSGSAMRRVLSYSMLAASIVLLFGSKSITSILTFFFLIGIYVLFFADSIFKDLRIGRLFSMTLVGSFLILAAAIFFMAPGLIDEGFAMIGKDATFTGRTELWIDLLDEVQKHFWLGCGFSSFWVVDNPNLLDLYMKYVWLPNEAHLGYLDILNETGAIGFLLFTIMVVAYFKDVLLSGKASYWVWFVALTLTVNFQESTLFRQNVLTGVMFIFGYMTLYADKIAQENALVNLHRYEDSEAPVAEWYP